MVSEQRVDAFTASVEDTEPRLKLALCSAFGLEVGMEATAEALAFAWEHWDRVATKPNPAGYLFGVGNTARRSTRQRSPVLPPVAQTGMPLVEPDLPHALEDLSERQRSGSSTAVSSLVRTRARSRDWTRPPVKSPTWSRSLKTWSS